MYVHHRKEPDGNQECYRMIGMYVDDLLCSGTKKLRKRANKLRDVTKLKETNETPFVFAGRIVQQEASCSITLDQKVHYELTKNRKNKYL